MSQLFYKSTFVALAFLFCLPLAFSQTGPANVVTCSSGGDPVVFLATFTNDPMMPVTVSEFSVSSFDGTFTIMTLPFPNPYNFTFTDIMGNSSGAIYSLGITHANNNYTFRLEVTAGVDLLIGSNEYTFVATTSSGTLSNVANLTVNELPEVFVDSPLSGTITTCVQQPIVITTSLTALPTSFRWLRDVTPIVSGTQGYTANLAGLANNNMTLARAGFYELELTTAGCPLVVSDPVEVIVKQNVLFNDLDMVPKQLLPGNTVSFTSRARNVDMTST
jgi:hypothetical protein